MEWILSCKPLFTFSCLLTTAKKQQKKTFAELRILLKTIDLFYLLSSFPVSFSFKGPPELHSAELLTFCSSFAFVPFVSVIKRERKEFRREECEGMFVSWTKMGGRQGGGGEGEGGPRGQEVVDESGVGGGGTGGLGQCRGGQRGLPQK